MTTGRDPWLRFAAWAVVGAGGCLSFLAGFSFGILLAPAVLVAAALLLARTPIDRSVLGAVSGAAAPLFYVAWVNREGPGMVCHLDASGESCSERWSPWPWLVVGVVLLSVGVAVFGYLGRATRAG
jgi:hypothetical protein